MPQRRGWKGVSRVERSDGSGYLGTHLPDGTPVTYRPDVPVADGLVECPVCHAGVRLVQAPFGDKDLGIKAKSPMLGAHQFGGHRVNKESSRCAGSSLPYREEP